MAQMSEGGKTTSPGIIADIKENFFQTIQKEEDDI